MSNCENAERNRTAVKVGDTFQKTVTLDAGAIKQFAIAAGDHNPLHHNEGLAAQSRFGGLIASGTHTSALILGLIASYLSERWPSLGLGFSVRLKKAVRAGETLTVSGRVVSITPKPSLRGDLAIIEAEMSNADGQAAVSVRSESLLIWG
jgi:acyl dehydratase